MLKEKRQQTFEMHDLKNSLNRIDFRKAISFFLVGIVALTGFQGKSKNDDLTRAKSTLQQIFILYDAGHDHLLNETYPNKSELLG